MSALFISDLHLGHSRPDKLSAFKQLLEGPAAGFDQLYILGDLFEEFWVGNDDTTPPNPDIIQTLKTFTQNQTRVFFIKGNRELLLDDEFTALTGVTLLPDTSVIDLDGEKALIMHGDLLCTLDRKYQLYRTVISSKFIKFLFRILPYPVRIRISHGLRPAMSRTKTSKPDDIMDVDPKAVDNIMNTFNVKVLIHGHTHRPAIHDIKVNNYDAQRIVLGDWYRQGEILICRNGNKELQPISHFLSRSKDN